MLCKKEATIFHIYGKKTPSNKDIWLKFEAFFYKIFEEFNNEWSLFVKKRRNNN